MNDPDSEKYFFGTMYRPEQVDNKGFKLYHFTTCSVSGSARTLRLRFPRSNELDLDVTISVGGPCLHPLRLRFP